MPNTGMKITFRNQRTELKGERNNLQRECLLVRKAVHVQLIAAHSVVDWVIGTSLPEFFFCSNLSLLQRLDNFSLLIQAGNGMQTALANV